MYLFTYLGENPYLVEFDETPRFWYPRVARDAWINFVSWSDQFLQSERRRSEKNQNIGFSEFLVEISAKSLVALIE